MLKVDMRLHFGQTNWFQIRIFKVFSQESVISSGKVNKHDGGGGVFVFGGGGGGVSGVGGLVVGVKNSFLG